MRSRKAQHMVKFYLFLGFDIIWKLGSSYFVHSKVILSIDCNGSYGYLKLADSYDFQEWNFEKNGFKVSRVSLSLHGLNESCL